MAGQRGILRDAGNSIQAGGVSQNGRQDPQGGDERTEEEALAFFGFFLHPFPVGVEIIGVVENHEIRIVCAHQRVERHRDLLLDLFEKLADTAVAFPIGIVDRHD